MDEFNIYDYIAILRRRIRSYIATAVIFFIIACVYAASISSYRSTATVQVQAPEITEGMTVPMGMNPNQLAEVLADQRIQQIQQKVMSSATLVDIITKLNLYPAARKTQPMVEIVEIMRKNVQLELLTTDPNGAAARGPQTAQMGAIAFNLSFIYGNPLQAQQGASEIVSRFLDSDMKERRTKAQETSAFLGVQITAQEKSMAEQERKIAEFRAQHPDARPESLAFNQQMAATTSTNMQDVDRQLSAVERSRGDLQAQLAGVDAYSRVIADGQVLTTPAVQLKSLQAKYTTLLGQYGQDHPDVVKLRRQIEGLQAETGVSDTTSDVRSHIVDTRTNLVAAEKTYGPNHPDVIALRSQLAALEQELIRQTRSAKPKTVIDKDADNPAYLMLVSQIQSMNAQALVLQKERDNLMQQRQRYMEIVGELPAIEQQFSTLSRDYENIQLRYRELKEKKMAADMTDQMEQGRMSERLVVIDPPQLPSRTVPSRLKVIIVGFIVSWFAGLGGVVLAEMLGRSVHGGRQLADITGQPPLVVIPHLQTRNETKKQYWRWSFIAGGFASVLVIFLIIFDQLIMPLDVTLSVIARRLGI